MRASGFSHLINDLLPIFDIYLLICCVIYFRARFFQAVSDGDVPRAPVSLTVLSVFESPFSVNVCFTHQNHVLFMYLLSSSLLLHSTNLIF